MIIFSIVFLKTVSVLLSVVIGFLAGKYSNVERDSISSLLFYFISPIVFFTIPASTTLTLAALSVTVVTFVITQHSYRSFLIIFLVNFGRIIHVIL